MQSCRRRRFAAIGRFSFAGALAAFLLCWGMPRACLSQGGFGGQGGPPGMNPKAALVLANGQVLIGTVEPAPSGFLVKKADKTEVVINRNQVLVAGKSLRECYDKLRDAVATDHADGHLTLGRWCLQHHLLEEAKSELQTVLRIDPGRSDARKLLRAIDEQTEKGQRAEPVQELSQRPAAVTARANGGLEGLTQEATSHFVQRIQPLLSSRCGNASCHGAIAGGDFQILAVSRTSTGGRGSTIANLQQVLDLIDHKEVRRSPLLQVLDDPGHWRRFAGPMSDEQNAEIRDWVLAVAEGRQSSGWPSGPADNAPASPHAVLASQNAMPIPTVPSKRSRVIDQTAGLDGGRPRPE